MFSLVGYIVVGLPSAVYSCGDVDRLKLSHSHMTVKQLSFIVRGEKSVATPYNVNTFLEFEGSVDLKVNLALL